MSVARPTEVQCAVQMASVERVHCDSSLLVLMSPIYRSFPIKNFYANREAVSL